MAGEDQGTGQTGVVTEGGRGRGLAGRGRQGTGLYGEAGVVMTAGWGKGGVRQVSAGESWGRQYTRQGTWKFIAEIKVGAGRGFELERGVAPGGRRGEP